MTASGAMPPASSAEPAQAAAPSYPTTGASRFVYRYIDQLPRLDGKVVIDVPSGDGRASHRFRSKGAEVIALDLFPEFMQAPGVKARFADMRQPLPVADEIADYVICQEGIEHVPDQLALLGELNRVLKPGGTLLLSTPSLSHASARVSWLLFETDFWRRMPPSEYDSVWVSDKEADRVYFGHLFLLGVHHLKTLASITGFTVTRRMRTDIGSSAVTLGVLLYPLLLMGSWLTYRTYSRKKAGLALASQARRRWRDHVQLNLAPTTLFCKHIFWELRKDHSPAARREQIRTMFVQPGWTE
jgi:SAM-dependent methyltransferase